MSTTTRRIDHAALFAVLSSLADNKQAVGRRYAYWCNGAPALEAAVAAAAMTQDELGHARTLYPLLDNFVQAEADLSQVEPETRTLHYSIAYLDNDFEGWSDFVATNFLFDSAMTTFFEAAQHCRPHLSGSGTKRSAGLGRTMIPSCDGSTTRALSTRPLTSCAAGT